MLLRDIGAAVRGMKPSSLGRAAVVVLIAALAVSSSPAGPRVSGHPASGRLVAAGPPTAVRAVTAVPANAAATVSFAAPASSGGSAITGYTVTAYVRGAPRAVRAFDASATTEVMGALANGQAYVFEVAARNAVGVGPRSKPSAPITVGAPTTPRSPHAIPGNASVTVRFAAPASNNGSAITAYLVTPYVANVAQKPRVFKPTATSGTVTGLANAKTYTFKVAAKNARGTSTQSSATSVTVGADRADPRDRSQERRLGDDAMECAVDRQRLVDHRLQDPRVSRGRVPARRPFRLDCHQRDGRRLEERRRVRVQDRGSERTRVRSVI